MGLRLPPPTCWSLCPAMIGPAAMAQAQAQAGARGPTDGRMPSGGCPLVSAQVLCGMPCHGAPWRCWPCSWQGRSTSRCPCQQDLGEQSTAVGAAPWTVSSHLPCGIRPPPCGDTSCPALIARLLGTTATGSSGWARKSPPLSPRASLRSAP